MERVIPKIMELKYSATNTYLIRAGGGSLLFDTGWAGTFPLFCRALGEAGATVQEIEYILISHYHPDHCGIAQEIADQGAKIVVPDVQEKALHEPDAVFAKEGRDSYVPIDDGKICRISCADSRGFFKQNLGLDGEILHTPGHSDDSISLCLDDGSLFVGDLNPLYELEMHRGTQISESWDILLAKKPCRIYYGHAKTAMPEAEQVLRGGKAKPIRDTRSDSDAEVYRLVKKILKYIDKGYPLDAIQKKTGADKTFLEDVTRMYLTHQNVGVQGILDRIEIKGR